MTTRDPSAAGQTFPASMQVDSVNASVAAMVWSNGSNLMIQKMFRQQQNYLTRRTRSSSLNFPYGGQHVWGTLTGSNYNSVQAAQEWLQNETGVCTTLRRNRDMAKCLRNINLKKNATGFRRRTRNLPKKKFFFDYTSPSSRSILGSDAQKSSNVCVESRETFLDYLLSAREVSVRDSFSLRSRFPLWLTFSKNTTNRHYSSLRLEIWW